MMLDDFQKVLECGYFDLHIHTKASDGIYSPAEIVCKAKQEGLKSIAITDHDTLDGVEEAKYEGNKVGLHVISGVELSTKYEGKSIDVLGYGMTNIHNLTAKLSRFQEGRIERALKIIDKFNELSMPITIEDVKQFSKGNVIARPHIAKAIVQKGYISDIQTVFDYYLGNGKLCDVDKEYLSTQESIGLIHKHGGLAVLAHPILINNNQLVRELLRNCIFDGIEVWHSKHNFTDNRKYKKMAKHFDLLMTGGSDFHNDEQKLGHFGLFWKG